MRIIAICGAAGAGKDTIANHLRQTQGAEIIRFADPLKDCACKYFGYTRDQLEQLEFKETPDQRWTGPDGEPRTPRKILQIIGTEGFRAVDPDYWVKSMRRRLWDLRTQDLEELIVIPDLRFVNEAGMLKTEGAELLKVYKDGGPGTEESAHISEQEWMQITEDYTIHGRHGDIPGVLREVDWALFGVSED